MKNMYLAIFLLLFSFLPCKSQTREVVVANNHNYLDDYGYIRAIDHYGYEMATMAWKNYYPLYSSDTTIKYSLFGFEKKTHIETIYLKKVFDEKMKRFVIVEEIIPSGEWDVNYLVFYEWILIFSFFIIHYFELQNENIRAIYSLFITIVYMLPMYFIINNYHFILCDFMVIFILIAFSVLLFFLGIDYYAPIIMTMFGFIYLIYMFKIIPIIIGIVLFVLSLLILNKLYFIHKKKYKRNL